VGSRPVAAEEAAQALVGKSLDDDAIVDAARLARQAATPMDNTDFQAQWRIH
jgi:CO/xanthine dehydrogenase FAD-binding subunit